MSLSIVIPCKNEEKIIKDTILKILDGITTFKIELIVIDDFSHDESYQIVEKLNKNNQKIKLIKNINHGGLGEAIKLGIKNSSEKYLCFFMADMSDSIEDLLRYYQEISKYDLDAVLGSRFITGSKIINYPTKKLILNRIFNKFTQLLFWSDYNDFTNAFKIYKRESLLKLSPIVSENFNVFLEIPLKLVYRGYSYKIISINWANRKVGNAKFKIKELGSKYFFTLFYCFLEKILIKKKKY